MISISVLQAVFSVSKNDRSVVRYAILTFEMSFFFFLFFFVLFFVLFFFLSKRRGTNL